MKKQKPNLSRSRLSLALSLSLGLSQAVQAQFTNPFQLSDLNGNNGFVIHGENADDQSGGSVSSAGDVNGDGIDDLIIGAHYADSSGNSFVGRSYVVFGSTSGLPDMLNLSDLNGSNGFVIHGENAVDLFGGSVSTAGDVNGDGIDDLVIGADAADPNDNLSAGSTYVIFGSSTGLANPFNVADLNGSNGLVIHGESAFDRSGRSVSSAGDVNGDGVDDLIIGADGANSSAGRSYVVFGSSSLPDTLNLSGLNGSNGFVISGENADDYSGNSVSSAGDVNGDGIGDLIIGADGVNSSTGRSYVVFGSSSLPSTLNLSNLNVSSGIVIRGGNPGDRLGQSVDSAGDVNGDGVDDLIIGADGANSGAENAGSSYVVFGSSSGLPGLLDVSSLNGSNGFAIHGDSFFDSLGGSVSSAGDLNYDGIDDLIVGARVASRSYVVYGSSSGLPGTLDVSNLNGSNGFAVHGESSGDRSGRSVSSAGDVNGDGINDLIIGANQTNSRAGSSYVIFGQEKPIFEDGFESP